MPSQKEAVTTGIYNLTIEHGDHVLPCPFCGSRAVELNNTHNASYWVECATCGAEHHGGKSVEVDDLKATLQRAPARGRSQAALARANKALLAAHMRAAKSALNAWNRRDYNQSEGF